MAGFFRLAHRKDTPLVGDRRHGRRNITPGDAIPSNRALGLSRMPDLDIGDCELIQTCELNDVEPLTDHHYTRSPAILTHSTPRGPAVDPAHAFVTATA